MSGSPRHFLDLSAVGAADLSGMIDDARFANALAQIATVYEFQTAPDAALYFTDAYLPEGGFALK